MPLPPFITEYIPREVLPALNDEWDRLRAQQDVLRNLEDSVTALREHIRINDQEQARFCDLSPISLSPRKQSQTSLNDSSSQFSEPIGSLFADEEPLAPFLCPLPSREAIEFHKHPNFLGYNHNYPGAMKRKKFFGKFECSLPLDACGCLQQQSTTKPRGATWKNPTR